MTQVKVATPSINRVHPDVDNCVTSIQSNMDSAMNYEQAQIIANSLCMEFESAHEYTGWTPAFPCCLVSHDNAVRFNKLAELHVWYDENLYDEGYRCFEIRNELPL